MLGAAMSVALPPLFIAAFQASLLILQTLWQTLTHHLRKPSGESNGVSESVWLLNEQMVNKEELE